MQFPSEALNFIKTYLLLHKTYAYFQFMHIVKTCLMHFGYWAKIKVSAEASLNFSALLSLNNHFVWVPPSSKSLYLFKYGRTLFFCNPHGTRADLHLGVLFTYCFLEMVLH